MADPAHAARVVKRLLEPDMWSGWGIRTLSSDNPPTTRTRISAARCGPHDNGIIALGFRRYGFAAEAARVARDISGAASSFVSYRLPELYAGIERGPATFPVLYPRARTCPRRGRRGPSFTSCKRSSASRPTHPTAVSSSTRRCPRGYRT